MAARVAAYADDGRPVAIFGLLEASTAVMMLGVLGAGRMVATLDASLSDDRLREQLATLDSGLLCTTSDQRARIASLCESAVVVIHLDEGDARAVHVPRPRVRADDPAVIVFTSGSTGRPKAVLQKHRRHLLRAKVFACTQISSMLLWQSLAYSGGVTAMLKVLLTGGAGVYYDLREKGLRGLSAVLAAHGIQQLTLPVSVFREYLSLIEQGELPPPLQVMRIGGQVYGRDLRRARALLRPETQLSNGYALSEVCTLADRFWQYGDVLPDDAELVPAGVPLSGRQIDLHDEHGRPVEPGQIGRIFVRAREVALGYYNDPAATAERFRVLDDAGTREYDTGDLGSFREDGWLRVHGRVDGVVTVRDARIGLREVDGALESLPQTTTSEIDRNAARDAAFGMPSQTTHTARSEAPPRGEIEAQLACIWTSVLGVPVHDRHADFFALGGHSLKAMRLVADVEKRFGVQMTLMELVQGPTLLEQAVLVRERGGRAGAAAAGRSTLTTYSSQGTGAPICIIPPNTGTVMAQIRLAKALGSGRPIHLLQSPGERPAFTFEALAEIYLQDVQQVAALGTMMLIAICGGMRTALVMAQRLQEQGREPELVVLLDPLTGRIHPRPRHRLTLGDHLHEIAAMVRHREYWSLRSWVLGGTVRTLLRPLSARYQRQHAMFVATSEAIWRYEQQPYSGRVLIVTTAEHEKLSAERRRWEAYCSGRYDVVCLPGTTHLDIVGAAAVQVAEAIERALKNSDSLL